MRVKDVFSVFPRKLRSGKVVFYYQCYDDNGNRSSGLSTGQVTKTAARAYCMRLYREGNLFPRKRRIPTFGEYAAPWWDWDTCEYLKNQKGRKDITQAYADNCRKMVKNQTGKQRMSMAFIEDWFFDDKTLGRLNRLHRQYPKLRLIVFSVSAISPGMIVRYVSWSHDSYLSLRSGGKEIRESLEEVFNGHRAVPSSLWERVDEYSRLPDFEPYLACREGETAEALTVSEHTVTNHLCNVYRKFGTRNRVEVLKLGVSKGILPADELMTYTVQS